MEGYYDGQDLLVSAFNKGVLGHNCHWPTVGLGEDICELYKTCKNNEQATCYLKLRYI